MTVDSFFSQISKQPADPIVISLQQFAADEAAKKIDVTIGVYKTEEGHSSYVFPSVQLAKQRLAEHDVGHCYTNMQGVPEYVAGARRIVFGDYCEEGRIASLQSIGGTGSLHMAMKLLRDAGLSHYYLGTPTWSNYEGMITNVGGDLEFYNHYDFESNEIDFKGLESTFINASSKSVFVLQACCHNPTGTDFSKSQWARIAELAKLKDIFLVIDSAYLGFSSGDTEVDAEGIRFLYEQGLEFIVCQSFSKNLGLYSERTGCTHVVLKDSETRRVVESQLVANFRSECSFAPAFGSRVAAIIMNDEKLTEVWRQDVNGVVSRLKALRSSIHTKLTQLRTPGNWDHVLKQTGLFWMTGLSQKQVAKLKDDYHVYLTGIGRVNLAGLNNSNLDYFCQSIDKVARNE